MSELRRFLLLPSARCVSLRRTSQNAGESGNQFSKHYPLGTSETAPSPSGYRADSAICSRNRFMNSRLAFRRWRYARWRSEFDEYWRGCGFGGRVTLFLVSDMDVVTSPATTTTILPYYFAPVVTDVPRPEQNDYGLFYPASSPVFLASPAMIYCRQVLECTRLTKQVRTYLGTLVGEGD